MKKNSFYVTTPIYYVTAAPHLGSLYSTLLADVAARYHRLLGNKVFFLTGTDEHGQKVAEAAKKAGKDPKSFVDAFIPAYISMWKLYAIDYTKFIRTTDADHIHAVQIWIERLKQQGDIYKGTYTGWYCTPCETFVTEKNHTENKEVTCPSCFRPTNQISEECYFFKLSAYQDRLLEFYENNPDFVTPKERLHEVISFIKEGLHDLSISRTTVTWGIPFPGDAAHVTYVWADALNNYITAIGYGSENGEQELHRWWPADMQILGKDIIRFHAIYWPAFLMAIGLAMPKKLLVHGWIKVDHQKMSKSLGNVVDPKMLAATYGVDQVRYYLTRKMAITHDSNFSTQDIEESINNELANDLGNLLNRCLVLAHKYSYTNVQNPRIWSSASIKLQASCKTMIDDVDQLMHEGFFYRAINRIWDYIHEVNAYFHAHEPWKLAVQNRELFQEVIAATGYSLRMIGILLWPVMPNVMEKLLGSLGVVVHCTSDQNIIQLYSVWDGPLVLHSIDPIFKKYEKLQEHKTMQESKQEEIISQVTIQDFAKLDIRVGRIEQCEMVEKSDKLLKLQVDFGSFGKKQILSGVRKYFTSEQLVGQKAIFVVNFPERSMLGHVSQGMMLTAIDGQRASIVQPSSDVELGSKIS